MQIQLSDIMDHYPDGTSLSAYQHICRLIARFGTSAKISIDEPGSHESLRDALDRADRGMVNYSF